MFRVANSGSAPSVAIVGYDQATRASLTGRERTEYAALCGDERRRDWLAGRLAAKRAVARRTGTIAATDVELVSRDGRAPRAFVRVGPSSTELAVALSIAHRDGWAVAAVVDGETRVGVDIERAHSIAESHTRYFVSPGERPALDRFGATAVWMLKEAAWKALALGDTTEFAALTLCVDRAGHIQGVRRKRRWYPAYAQLQRHPFGLRSAVIVIPQDIQ